MLFRVRRCSADIDEANVDDDDAKYATGKRSDDARQFSVIPVFMSVRSNKFI
jgi:hypothetical protein